jgi:feruloyl esterase
VLAAVLGVAAVYVFSPPAAASVLACADLAKQNFAAIPEAPTTVLSANLVAANDKLPGYCRVRGSVTSHVGFELRLPLERWNGKILMQGCLGYCGMIMIEDADDALAKGYATVATDLGHSGTPLDATWAYDNRDAEIDFGFRATHVVTVAAKAIVDAFNGKAPSRSYFRGCDTGGRQGLVAAEQYPADFDGIIAGAPASTKLGLIGDYWSAMANLDAQKHALLTPQHIYLLRGAVMAKCDALDGLKDGIIEDPRACNFEPKQLLCKGFTSGFVARTDCLTPAQVDVVQKLYDPPATADGAQLTPGGLTPGSELNWLGTIVAADGGAGLNLKYAEDAMRFAAFAQDPGPTFTVDQFDLDRDVEKLNFMDRLTNGFNPDVRGFRDRGGRLILYHGWQGAGALNTVDFYETAAAAAGGLDEMAGFARLFMVPGMNQCSGGPGANTFDFLAALEDWVEFGKAPDSLKGTHVDENGAEGFSRPVYAYPYFARYEGKSDHIVAESFKRQTPKQ